MTTKVVYLVARTRPLINYFSESQTSSVFTRDVTPSFVILPNLINIKLLQIDIYG